MKIATWNVNSVRAREERVLAWLEKVSPDVLCLQELKVTDDKFPVEAVREAGYHASVFGQKTYNGVAILSREEPGEVRRGLEDDDAQARLIWATFGEVHVISAYVPNGQAVGSEKYAYKMAWYTRLLDRLDAWFSPEDKVVLCGDFNVARDDADVANPEAWAQSTLCHETSREAWGRLCDWGLVDVFREKHPEGGVYSWWDYRNLGFPKNDGLRIDHILATPPVAKTCTGAFIDRDERKKGKGGMPSDHAPVVAEFGG